MQNITTTFGAGATLDKTTPSDPILGIHIKDLINHNFNDLTAITATTDGDKLLVAILNHLYNISVLATNESADVVISSIPRQSFSTRNGTQRLVYAYAIDAYGQLITGSILPDPDSLP